MARHVPGRPEASTVIIRIVPGHSSTDASDSTKEAFPAAISALVRRVKAQMPIRSTISRLLWATVVTGPRGGSSLAMEISARVSSGSVTTIAREAAVGLTPASRGRGCATVRPPPKCCVMASATMAGSVSPTTITVMLLGTYQLE
jgi:hypothetical protein